MHKQCPYCNVQINVHQAIRPGHCGKSECTANHISSTANAAMQNRLDTYCNQCSRAKDQKKEEIKQISVQFKIPPEDIKVAIVPYQNESLVPLSNHRRTQFEIHLNSIINSAFDKTDVSTSFALFSREVEPENELISAGCATCQGSCCKQGGQNNAFLTGDLFRYFIQKTPELTPEVIRSTYLNALPEISVENACVFQGSQGCVLDRTLRANTCNSFHCYDVITMFQNIQDTNKSTVAIIAIDDEKKEPQSIAGYNQALGWQPLDSQE
jgi:hypothetical protein